MSKAIFLRDIPLVPVRACTVSFTAHVGIRHSVNVQAETLYEAVVLASRASVSMAKVQDWLRSSANSPSDKIMKERLKGLLAS